ncbi:MAG: DUF721 domain-containing protein, partial [Cyanobacteria bacterium P01_D01_bin.73]
MGNFDPISHVLANVEQNPHWQQRQQLRRICNNWEAIVGKTVAEHARPVAVKNQQLRIATTSNSWSQNLMFERQRLLKKLNQHFQSAPLNPPIHQLHFSTARWTQPKPAPVAPQQTVRDRQPSQTRNSSPSQGITAKQAFDNWAQHIQQQTSAYPPCPICKAPTPPQDLDRWQCCSPCATHQWRT